MDCEGSRRRCTLFEQSLTVLPTIGFHHFRRGCGRGGGGGGGGGISSRVLEQQFCVSRVRKQIFTFSRRLKIEVV